MNMIDIVTGTREEKIIRALQEAYPITVAELGQRLHLSPRTLSFELRKLQSKGLVGLEPLPDKTYVRLLRTDIRFVGRRHQEKFIKRRRHRYRCQEEQSDDPMFR